jgi:hypothetical protein
LPIIGLILRDFYFKPLIVIVTLLCLVTLFWEYRTRLVSFFGGLFFGSALASTMCLMTPEGTYFTEFTQILMYFLVPTSCLAARHFAKQGSIRSRALILLSMLIMPSFFTMFTYSSEYAEVTHAWEETGYRFCSTHFPSRGYVGTDVLTDISYRFFDLAYSPGQRVVNLFEINLTQRLVNHPVFFEEDIIIRSLRQELTPNRLTRTFAERIDFWAKVDANLVSERSYNRFYDNSYLQLYGTAH